MSILLNRPQLAGRAEICDATLVKLVHSGVIRPDALDARGRWLFSEGRVDEVKAKMHRKSTGAAA